MEKLAKVSLSRLLRDRMSSLFGTMLLSKLNGEERKFQLKPLMKLSKINSLIIKMSSKLLEQDLIFSR
jgi:hypothetical protein